jgi:hypothetical protein
LLELGLPGVIFLGLCVWLVRKVLKAARTESDFEAERLRDAVASGSGFRPQTVPEREREREPEPEPERKPEPESQPAPDLLGDVSGADPAHIPLIAELVAERELTLRQRHKGPTDVPRRVEVLWVRSNATHAVWCERRHAATMAAQGMTRDILCVAQIDHGKVVDRWSFG